MKVDDIFESTTNEGVFDYLRGAGKVAKVKARDQLDKVAERGRKILEPFRDMHQAGQVASKQADQRKALEQAQASVPKLIELIGKNAIQLKQITTQLKALPESVVHEGLFDYLRGSTGALGGAAKQVGTAVKTAATQVHQKGQRSSLVATSNDLKSKQADLVNRLVKVFKQLNVSKEEALKIINKQLGVKSAAAYWTRLAIAAAFDSLQPSDSLQTTAQPTQQAPTRRPTGRYN